MEQSGRSAILAKNPLMAYHAQVKAPDLEKQARYLMSVACLVKDAVKHDELQRQAQELLRKGAMLRLSLEI